MKKKQQYVVDFDDFTDIDTGFRWLFHLKKREPAFRATLFCIPMGTSRPMLNILKGMGWLEPAVHGWRHRPLECKNWTKDWSLEVLRACEKAGFAKVFRAPHWEINDNLYQALLERDWICADHPKNKARRPTGLKVYVTDDEPGRIHGHINYGDFGNSLDAALGKYEALHGEFRFISELFAEEPVKLLKHKGSFRGD